MTHDWFVIRDGKERGPFTAQQLKEMAGKGDLAPNDLVRRADMQAPRKASVIKGLFAPVDPVPTKSSPSPTTATAATAEATNPEWFYTQTGVRHGPVTEKHIKELANTGRLRPTDLVWRATMMEWQSAGSIEGLFPPSAAPVSEPPSAIRPSPPPLPVQSPPAESPPVSASPTATATSLRAERHTDSLTSSPIRASLKFDWHNWDMGGRIIFIAACAAVVTMLTKWVDVGIASANGFSQGAFLFLGVYAYPLWKLLRGEPINRTVGIFSGSGGIVLALGFVASKQLNFFGREVNVAGEGPFLFLSTCIALIVGVVKHRGSFMPQDVALPQLVFQESTASVSPCTPIGTKDRVIAWCRKYPRRAILVAVGTGGVFLFLFCAGVGWWQERGKIQQVKDQRIEANPKYTIGEVLDTVCENPSWTRTRAKKKNSSGEYTIEVEVVRVAVHEKMQKLAQLRESPTVSIGGMPVPGCLECAALRESVDQLQAEVTRLRAELAAAKKDSSNSSKPPSSDIVKKPQAKLPPGSKRRRGGQPGHTRFLRPLLSDEQVQYTDLYCVECPTCHGPVVLSTEPPKVIQRIELPLPSELIALTGVRTHACWCRRCQQVHYAPLDEATQRADLLGSRLTALIAYLKGACHCSYATIRKFLRDVLGLTLSRGYLAKLIAKASASLQNAYDTLAARLPHEPRLNVDETGHKNNKEAMWTWCFRASLFTLFKIDASRGSNVLLDVLGSEFNGVLGCDYFSAYRKYMKDCGVLVQFCLAHLLRDVRFLVEHPNPRNRAYGRRVLARLRALFAVIHDREQYTAAGFTIALQNAGDELYAEAIWRVPTTREADNLATRFEKHGASYLRFITTPGIEPTNNLAEQAIRFVVIDRKVTQGTRSSTGQRWCERIWTAIATCSQTGHSIFTFLENSLTAYVTGQPPPQLLPDGT